MTTELLNGFENDNAVARIQILGTFTYCARSHVTHSRDKTQLFRHNHEILAKLDHQRYLKPTKVKKNAKMLFYLVLSGNAVAC